MKRLTKLDWYILLKVLLLGVLIIKTDYLCNTFVVHADYENSWISYKEQPCCNSNDKHHFRHHRGKFT